MSGNYQPANADAPGGVNETMAAAVAANAQALADCTAGQSDAERFLRVSGAAASPGHGVVEGPAGVGGDADL